MPESHHDHLINLRTGEVIEFQSEEIERLQAEVARRLGYKLVDHRLELYALPLNDKTQRLRAVMSRFSGKGAKPARQRLDAARSPANDPTTECLMDCWTEEGVVPERTLTRPA